MGIFSFSKNTAPTSDPFSQAEEDAVYQQKMLRDLEKRKALEQMQQLQNMYAQSSYANQINQGYAGMGGSLGITTSSSTGSGYATSISVSHLSVAELRSIIAEEIHKALNPKPMKEE